MCHDTAIYEQKTGRFYIVGCVDESPNERILYETYGYAGRGIGRNNPAMEAVRNVGPLPVGWYRVQAILHDKFRKPAYRLFPEPANEMHRRAGFWIHGNNAENDASEGCIILGWEDRVAIDTYGITRLWVVAGEVQARAEAA